MASDFLTRKAKERAAKIDEKYGSNAYGGSSMLLPETKPNQNAAPQLEQSGSKTADPAAKTNGVSNFLAKKVLEQTTKANEKYGTNAYGGAKWMRAVNQEDMVPDMPTTQERAQQAQKAYEEYLASDEYKTDKAAVVGKAVSAATNEAEYYAAEKKQPQKEQELKAAMEYWQQQVNEEESNRVTQANMEEFQTWSEEDQNTLKRAVLGDSMVLAGPVSVVLSQLTKNSLAKKYGKERVEEIAESLRRYYNQQATEKVEQAGTEMAKTGLGKYVGSRSSVVSNLVGSATSPLGYVDELLRGRTGQYSTMDPNNAGNLPYVFASAIRQQVASDIEGDGGTAGKVGSVVYQAGMSAVDNLARAFMGGGSKTISLGLAASGSFGQSMSEASKQGATPMQAMVLSTAKAGLEVATEYLPLDNLLKQAKGGTQTAKQLIGNILKQGAIEATEEEVNFLGSLLAEAAILQEKSSYKQQIGELMAQGMTYAEAQENANWAVVNEAISTAVTSWLSGSMSSGATGIMTNAANRGQQVQNQTEAPAETFADEVMRQMTGEKTGDTGTGSPGVQFQTTEKVDQEKVDQANRLSQAIGREVVFYTAPVTETGIENGYYQDGKIYINTRSENPVAQIVSHELTHGVETADVYSKLSAIVMDRIKAQGGDLQQLRRQKQDLYARNGHVLNDDGADREIVAEYVEKHLLADEQSIVDLTRQDRSLSQKILNWIDSILAKLGNKNAQERAFLNRARNLYAQALQQTQTSFTPQTMATDTKSGAEETAVSDDAQDVLQWAREQYAAGNMTEEEFDGILEYVMQQEDLEGGGTVSGTSYSITEIQGKKDEYGTGVLLDTDIFDGVRPRDWGKTLSNYVYNNLAGAELTVFDENGNPETIHLAGRNDRVKKDGAKNSHKVIDKLARYRGDNISALATVHLSELLETSKYENSTDEHSHQWMDEGGWEYRKTYMQDRNGNIYEATLNIANGRDRRVLYAINNVRQIDKKRAARGVVPSTISGRGSLTKSNSLENSLPNDSESVKRQYSISETENTEEEARTAEQIREALPAKARDYLARAERKLLNDIGQKLNVPKFARREYLQDIVREISNEYLQTGTVADDKVDFLFDRAYAEGIIVDREFYDKFKEVKDHIRTVGVTISKQDQSDIADFNDFRKKSFGTVRIVNEGGLPVDVAYMELHGMAPSLFPESITHPADQLVRMYDVAQSIRISEKSLQEYYGEDAEEYRRWAKNDFAASVGDVMGELHTVKRFADEWATAAETEKAPTTPEEAAEAWKQLKDARRTYEKVMAKNLLTDHDEMQVGRLLRGEILPEHLDSEKDNIKGITAVYEAKREYEHLTKLLGEYRRSVRAKHREKADSYLETANDWKDKRVGIAYSRETMRRNVYDIVPERAVAESVNEEYFEPVHDAEADAVRFKNDFRDRVRALGLSTKPKRGNLVSEAHAVQLLGEAEDNIRVLQNSKGRLKQRDGKTLAEWHAVVNDLWKESPDLDRTKVQNAVTEFRKIYDELFQQMNGVRIRNGYEPVNYRQGYFPHFQPGDGDGILAHFGKVMGIDTQVAALPTTINGLTHTFKPGIQWFGNAQERLGFNTAYDAVEGFDKYIEGVASVIYQTENIQKLRALATQIRYRTSEEGIRKQVDAVNADTRLTEEEKQIKINDIYEHGKYTLSNFVNELDEYTNLLANKKSKLDRTMEAMMGRKAYTIMKAWESRVGANMIAGNLSSAMTNFIPLTQAGAQLDSGSIIKGMVHTLKSYKEDDGLVGLSSFLTNRRGSDPLIRTWQQKASQVMGTPMELIDNFTADSIVRAAYFQNLKRGMSEAEAMHQADIFASSVMADRSKGAMPTLFESTNPIFKAFTQFQLEVNNQYSEVFKDLPRNHRDKGLAALAGVLLKYFLGAFLYNEAYEFFAGRRPALDPLGIINDTVGDLTGYELPNMIELATGQDRSFETEKVGIGEAGKNLTSTVLGELPFSSGLTLMGIETDGGRIPASSAVPDLTALWDAATTEGWSAEKRWKEASDELSKLMYVVPPFGGNQAQKIWKGVSAYIQGGSYNVDAEGNDILQYPVFNDDPGDFWSLVRASILGKSSLKPAQDWVESGFKSLSAKQTAAYQDMTAAGVKDREAFELLQQLQGADGADAQREILRGSAVSAEGKAIAYYGLIASDSERELMDLLAEAGADQGEMIGLMMDLKDAGSLKDDEKKRAHKDALANAPLTDEEKMIVVGSILGTELTTQSGSPTQYANFLAAVDSGLSVDRFMDLHVGGADMEDYLTLTDAGVNPEEAADLALALCELEPEAGEESVSRQQKWQVIVDSDLSEGEQMTALSTAMTESELGKLEAGYTFGVTPKAYVEFKGLLPDYDADGNGSFTQQEVKDAIDALSGGEVDVLLQLMGETSEGLGLTNQQKAVLWQLQNKSWKPRKNPYDRDVGQLVYDALHSAEGDEEEQETEDELLKQLLGLG